MSLVSVFWDRVEHILSTGTVDIAHLKQHLSKNKNTYTAWFSKRWRDKRPDIRLSAVEELSLLLSVSPAELMRDSAMSQLELSFPDDQRAVQLEIFCSNTSLIVRKPAASQARSDEDPAVEKLA